MKGVSRNNWRRPPPAGIIMADAAARERARHHPVPNQFYNAKTGLWQPFDQPPPFSSSTTAGVIAVVLLAVCTCAYFSRTPHTQSWFSTKRGPAGVLYKAAIVGSRLHAWVAVACMVMGFYVMMFA